MASASPSMDFGRIEQIQRAADHACQSVVKLLKASHSSFMKLASDGQSGRLIAEYPLHIGVKETVIPIGGVPVEEQLVEHKRPKQIPDINREENFGRVAEILRKFDIRSLLIVPVVVNGRMIGSFSVDSIGATRIFQEDEIQLASAFALQVQMAFENALLLDETRGAHEQLQLLLRASNAAVEGNDLGKLASLLVELVGNVFCCFFVLNESGTSLVLNAAEKASAIQWNPIIGDLFELAHYPGADSFLGGSDYALLNREDERHREHLQDLGRHLGLCGDMESLLAVPLRSSSGPIGALLLGHCGQRESSPLTEDKIELACAIASQTALQIENRRSHEIAVRRRDLLDQLDRYSDTLNSEREPDKILKELVRLAMSIMHGSAAGILENRGSDLELKHVLGLSQDYIGLVTLIHEGVVGEVARTGKPRLILDYRNYPGRSSAMEEQQFENFAAVPLKHLGKVNHVLFVADRSVPEQKSQKRFVEADLDFLNRLAARAAAAWNAAKLMTPETRRMQNLAMLHQSLSYLRDAQDLERIYQVILTTVTARWGRRFNRAALFLYDDWKGTLRVALAIGQLSDERAREAWAEAARNGVDDPLQYLERIAQGLFQHTELDLALRHFECQVPKQRDAFYGALFDPAPRQLSPHALPAALRELWRSDSLVLVAPLIAEGRSIGLIVADNEFTREEVGREDEDILRSFCDGCAFTLNRLQRQKEDQVAQQRLRELLKQSATLLESGRGSQMLPRILKHAVEVAHADALGLILTSDQGEFRQVATYPDEQFELLRSLERSPTSKEVAELGKARGISDINARKDDFDSAIFASCYDAAACFPIESDQGKGSVWLLYREARPWDEGELDDLQLYLKLASLLYDSVQRERETKTLLDAAKEMSGKLDDELYQSIVQQACAITGAAAATVWPYDDKEGRFVPQRAASYPIPIEKWHPPRQGHETFAIARSGYTSGNYPEMSRMSDATRDLVAENELSSYQGVRLQVGQETVGVLYVSYKQTRHFTAHDRWLLEKSFALFAGLALKRAEVWRQFNAAKRSIETIASVAVQNDLELTLESIAQQARKASQCDAVTLYNYDPMRGRLTNPPTMEGVWFPDRVHSEDDQVAVSEFLEKIFDKDEPSIDLPDFRLTRFSKEERVRACIALPLKFGAQKIGLLFLNYREPEVSGKSIPPDVETLKLLGKQAAVTLHHAKMIVDKADELERSERDKKALQVLNDAARAIIGSDRHDVLPLIVEHAVACVSVSEAKAEVRGVMLLHEDLDLVVRSVYPLKAAKLLGHAIGTRIPRRDQRAAIDRKPLQVGDLTQDTDYLATDPSTQSELRALLLLQDDEPVGVLCVQADEPDFFDEKDETTLKALADLAGIAIQKDRFRRAAEQADKKVIEEVMKCCHDLRSPLKPVLSNLQALFTDGELKPVQKRAARIAWQKAFETSELIARVLDISRGLNREVCSIWSLLRDVLSDHEDLKLEKEISVDLEVLPEELEAAIDPTRLRRALGNILHNALRHGPLGSRVQISAQRRENNIRFSIRNVGPGMSDDERAKIFEPGYSTVGSTGLGMAITREEVGLHGGRVWFDSYKASGTVFFVELPAEA